MGQLLFIYFKLYKLPIRVLLGRRWRGRDRRSGVAGAREIGVHAPRTHAASTALQRVPFRALSASLAWIDRHRKIE
jgi:hypothetical protein